MRPHRLRRPLARIACDESAVTIVEFGIVAPVMLLMLMGFFDLAHTEYARSVLQGSIQMAARNSTLESGQTTGSTIDAYVKNQVKSVVGSNATFTSARLSYSDFSDVGKAEPYTDTNGNGKYDHGECFEDDNGNGQWDSDMGASGQGGADDAVLYTMTVTYKRMFPMATMLGWPANQTIVAATVLRNQPYGVQSSATPPTICT
ncbi:MAG TPA: TadE/TadG family type IV pilus assembly protein [Allosphingosinicella sp.]|jgi:Flp pilus assembly protein TadG|nr:TadE/TadG family type IV pilus assembly protein [Allosphingosinicella sp.]